RFGVRECGSRGAHVLLAAAARGRGELSTRGRELRPDLSGRACQRTKPVRGPAPPTGFGRRYLPSPTCCDRAPCRHPGCRGSRHAPLGTGPVVPGRASSPSQTTENPTRAPTPPPPGPATGSSVPEARVSNALALTDLVSERTVEGRNPTGPRAGGYRASRWA